MFYKLRLNLISKYLFSLFLNQFREFFAGREFLTAKAQKRKILCAGFKKICVIVELTD